MAAAPASFRGARQPLAATACAVIMTLSAACPGQSGWPCAYDVQIIHGPVCGDGHEVEATPMALTDSGQACGYYTACNIGPQRAFASFDGVTFTTLPMPAGTSQSRANDIAPDGRIVGDYVDDGATQQERAFLLHDGVFTDLGMPPTGNRALGEAINARGEIVGAWGNVNLYFPRPYVWRDGAMIDLTADFTLPSTYPKDINDAGEITGYTGNPVYPPDYRAFIWREGKVTILPLDGLDGAFASEGMAINNLGQVAGIWWKPHDIFPFWKRRAFFWDGQTMHDLGLVSQANYLSASAYDVNNHAEIVGGGTASGTSFVGFVSRDHVLTDLTPLLTVPNLRIGRPMSITDDGRIVAEGLFLGVGREFTTILTPIYPPPGDINCDQVVDIDDLLGVVGTWFADGGPTDLNNDDIVDLSDLLIVVDHWSQ